MTQHVIFKEDSSLDKQLEQWAAFLQGPLPDEVHEQVGQEIRFIKENGYIPIFILCNLYITNGDLSAQIDFLAVTRKMNFGCKNLYGNIEIDAKC